MITLFGAIFIAIFSIVSRPFESTSLNKMDVFNELSVCLSTYMLYAYTDIIGDMDTLNMFGWVSIGLMGLNILCNLTFMVLISCL